jgi:hypothetical protein
VSELTDFLSHNVEDYLFYDLRVMQKISPEPGAPGGGLGYPLLMTTFSGIELLGALLSPQGFDTYSGDRYFKEYWQKFLYPDKSTALSDLAIVYKLARHGIGHTFLLKGPLGVVKGQPTYHLKHGEKGEFYIDAIELSSDLIDSYEKRVKPLLAVSTNADMMAQRLNEISKSYASVAAVTLIAPVGSTAVSPPPVGASGAVGGPVPSSVSSTQGLSMP